MDSRWPEEEQHKLENNDSAKEYNGTNCASVIFFFFFGYMFHLTSYFSSVFIKASVRFLDKAVVILGVARARIHIQGELIRRW